MALQASSAYSCGKLHNLRRFPVDSYLDSLHPQDVEKSSEPVFFSFDDNKM